MLGSSRAWPCSSPASAQTGHSQASGHKSGGKWVVENGAIIGSQDIPGNGGILITDQQFGDFEVVLEMNNDFGPDSGLFLRSTEAGKCYQAMIDYHAGGNLMGTRISLLPRHAFWASDRISPTSSSPLAPQPRLPAGICGRNCSYRP